MTAIALSGISIISQDGSGGAPANGSFQISSFFNGYAQQYGQSYTTRPGWRVAGVDYAIGIASNATITIASPAVITETAHNHTATDKVVFYSTGTLPTGIVSGTEYFVIATGLTTNAFEISATSGGAAINTSGAQSGFHRCLKDPAATASLPSGVTYVPAPDTPYSFPAFQIAGSSNVVLDHYDYSLNNGVGVDVTQNYSGTLTLSNSQIQPGTNMFGHLADILMVGNDTTIQSYSLTISNCVLNGDSHNPTLIAAYNSNPASFFMIRFTSSGTLTLQYCAITKVWGRAIVQKFSGQGIFQYNYWEDCNYNTGAHGEWISTDPQTNVCPLIHFSYNTFLTPAISAGGMTCHLFATGGTAVAGSITTWQVDHCSFVVNPSSFPGGIAGTTLTVDSSFQSPNGQAIAVGFTTRDVLNFGGTQWTIGTQLTGSPPNQAGTYNVAPSGSVTDGTLFYLLTQETVGVQFSDDTAVGTFLMDSCYFDGTGGHIANQHDTTYPTTATITNCFNLVGGGAVSTPYQVLNTQW